MNDMFVGKACELHEQTEIRRRWWPLRIAAVARNFVSEWDYWAANDPYYGVLTIDKYRRQAIPYNRLTFFETGENYIQDLLERVALRFGSTPSRRALEAVSKRHRKGLKTESPSESRGLNPLLLGPIDVDPRDPSRP
jgi:hypothetical protein